MDNAIVVIGHPTNYGIAGGAGGGGTPQGSGEASDHPSPHPYIDPESNGGATFAFELDLLVDQIAKDTLAVFSELQKTDKLHEYGARVWMDPVTKEVHRTAIFKGDTTVSLVKLDENGKALRDSNNNLIPLSLAEQGIPQNAILLATIHSHPLQFNGGSPTQPLIQDTNPIAATPSEGDMFGLWDLSQRANAAGLDTAIYVAFGDKITEYNASDQDFSNISAGGTASWAVASDWFVL